MLAEDAKTLTSELSTFLESGRAQGQGAILVSMGTLARMTDDEVHSMAAGLSALPNPVLWKLDSSYLQGEPFVSVVPVANQSCTWSPLQLNLLPIKPSLLPIAAAPCLLRLHMLSQ